MGTPNEPDRHLLPRQERLCLDAHRERMEAGLGAAEDQQSGNLCEVESKGRQVRRWERCQVGQHLSDHES